MLKLLTVPIQGILEKLMHVYTHKSIHSSTVLNSQNFCGRWGWKHKCPLALERINYGDFPGAPEAEILSF